MAMISNISSKYKDIISKSVQIHSGSPAIYQLKPNIETFGTLTRKTVGERNLNKENKTILLVGETGTGKSTLINALVNYSMGVKFEDDIWFEIVEEERRSQSESQTSDVIVYEIFDFEGKTLPYSLTIIDTPGYGDTRGIEYDREVCKRLFDLFCSEDGVHEINAVGLVLKASENRLSDRLTYIFNSVMSLLGKDMEKNIVTLITNSNGMPPRNVLEALQVANIKCAKNEKNQPVHFLFDNCQSTERTEETEFGLENTWRVTERGMKQFSKLLETSTPQNLTTTVELFKTSLKLTKCLNNLQARIKFIDVKQKEIQQTQVAVKIYEKEMNDDKNFTIEVDEPYIEKKPVKFTYLFFFNETKYVDVVKTRRVKTTLENVKQRYEQKTKDEKGVLENLEKKMRDLTAEKNLLLEEAYQHVLELEQIALKIDSLSSYAHLDFLIEKIRETEDTEKVQKLEAMRSRIQADGVSAALRYK